MNQRIRKKAAKRQMIKAMQELVDLADSQKRQREEALQRLAEAFGRCYEKNAEKGGSREWKP